MNVIKSAVKVPSKSTGPSTESKKDDEWRDHKVKLSYILNDEDGQIYPCLCKRFRTDPSFRVYEADERKGGKLVHVKRNIFVAPYELVEITIGTPRHIWYVRLNYKDHNVVRRRATRDDTWPVEEWLDKICASVQDPPGNPRMHFFLREKPNRLGLGNDFEFEIKEKNNGKVVKYINPATLRLVPPGHYESLSEKDKKMIFGKHTVLPPSPQVFLNEIYLINHDAFTRLCKVGNVKALQKFLELGYVDPKAFTQSDGSEFSGWCPLQHAAYNGRTEAVSWLLDEVKVPWDARSADGWTSMHCACLKGHFEIAKILHGKGASIFDSTREDETGMTPMILMMENKHSDMVRYFMDEESKYAGECYEGHGYRSTFIPIDMYNWLKPLPADVMEEIEEAQRIKIAGIEQRKKEEYFKDNPEALRKLVSGNGRNGNTRKGSSQSRSPSRGNMSRAPSSDTKQSSPSRGGSKQSGRTSSKSGKRK